MDHIKDLHARPTENETWPEPQVGGSSEATETSPSLPDLPLPVVEPTEVPTSVPVPRSPPNEVPVPWIANECKLIESDCTSVDAITWIANDCKLIESDCTSVDAKRYSSLAEARRTHQKPDGTTIIICEGGV